MTSCRCKDLKHANHRDEPCENIGSESNGLCKACDDLTKAALAAKAKAAGA